MPVSTTDERPPIHSWSGCVCRVRSRLRVRLRRTQGFDWSREWESGSIPDSCPARPGHAVNAHGFSRSSWHSQVYYAGAYHSLASMEDGRVNGMKIRQKRLPPQLAWVQLDGTREEAMRIRDGLREHDRVLSPLPPCKSVGIHVMLTYEVVTISPLYPLTSVIP